MISMVKLEFIQNSRLYRGWAGQCAVAAAFVVFHTGCGDDPKPVDSTPAVSNLKTDELPEKSQPSEETTVDEVLIAPDEPKNTLRELADSDGDGKLSKDEFMAFMAERDKERPPKPKPTPEQVRRLRERDSDQPVLKGARTALLEKFDHDRDGAFSPAEKAEAQEYLDRREQERKALEIPE